jgi:hypothetical protein
MAVFIVAAVKASNMTWMMVFYMFFPALCCYQNYTKETLNDSLSPVKP